ncbi:MBL fold metallo-hydrolase [Streptomyces albiaxialis]|uniref:MBL fold metallo-hydrolase n=1 Tax=Streptomyces albiaxialis TaxID=329523 RepID=A0ABN2W147_9ACTN
MYVVETLATESLGNRSYLVAGPARAVAVDPPRDIDRVLEAAARRGVRIARVVETHVHNDYVSGGLELARLTGADYAVPAGARVSYARTPVEDGDELDVDEGLTLRAVATPGHTPHHTAYVLHDAGVPVAAFTGGSLLLGTVGRPDLVEPRLTEDLARAQHASAHRLAELPDAVRVLPTHGFGSFCASTQSGGGDGEAATIGAERGRNLALTKDVDTFVAELLAGLDDVPAYYAHMGPVNGAGPAPIDLTPPRAADAAELAERLAAGEWVVDLRSRTAFADGHLAGALNFDGGLATYLAWLIPWGKPVTLLAETAEEIAAAQRELARVGIDRPAAAATGPWEGWLRDGDAPRSFPRADFAALARARAHAREGGAPPVVLDVRRDIERGEGWVRGSTHIPLHQLPQRLADVPEGTVWVHCAGGMRAAMAASFLDAAGRDVVAVDDTFDAAHAAELVTVPGA